MYSGSPTNSRRISFAEQQAIESERSRIVEHIIRVRVAGLNVPQATYARLKALRDVS